ncbi:MAG: penicillin acylase family protein [Bdellovibrionota bacterium]
MKKFLIIFLSTFSIITVISAYIVIKRQGVESSYWKQFDTANISFDKFGIPTISATDWISATEAQGFVLAAERLWQMDLMRRKAYGRLAELFGTAASEYDQSKQKEDWIGTAALAAEKLPPMQKKHCQAYAKGVNKFIDQFPNRWGIEYLLLRTHPEPWSCSDTISILMLMSEQLSSKAGYELKESIWRSHLSPSWQKFLFPREHPWNKPLFGQASGKPLPLPKKSEWINQGNFKIEQHASNIVEDTDVIGSNSWAWKDDNKIFLANDPHLGASVPALWYALRIKISKAKWVVGASLPGLPGITLGMNQHIAWAFTNSGEDVDDYLEETVNTKGQYLRIENGAQVWRTPIEKEVIIKIRNTKSKTITTLFSDIGPIFKDSSTGKWYSRRWLAIKGDKLKLPIIELNQASNWQEFNTAIDTMTTPSQNVLFVNRKGDIGYRLSGTEIKRTESGLLPKSAINNNWTFPSPSHRLRKFFPAQEKQKTILATANQRIWVDTTGHHFADDAREKRIMEVLNSKSNITANDIQDLHNDTHSQYHKILLSWILQNNTYNNKVSSSRLSRWKNWDGDAKSDSKTFTEILWMENHLANLLIAQIREQFLPPEQKDTRYWCLLRRAWMLRILNLDDGMHIFGFEDQEVATWLVKNLLTTPNIRPHYFTNRWQAQHPFVGRIPIIGDLFRVGEYPQYGFRNLVKVENPKYGASMRLLWDLQNPEKSTWIFPVGQSGHIGSKHYKDFQESWHFDKTFPVFSDSKNWDFL